MQHPSQPPMISVLDEARMDEAVELAGILGVQVVRGRIDDRADGAMLIYAEDGLGLEGNGLHLRADLSKMIPRLRAGNLNRELLVKAARGKSAQMTGRAIDATAGLGEDALLLAAAGWDVVMLEKDVVIAALLDDALKRAADNPVLSPVVERLDLIECDSIEFLADLKEDVDVVYLDPMFPDRGRSSLAKKKFQLLHMLEGPCPDDAALLEAAFSVHPRKVVVKRPLKGDALGGRKPSYSLRGKTVRYDCYVSIVE